MPITADNRPTDYEYAVLSDQAYNVNLKKDSPVDVLPGWKVKRIQRGAMDFRVVIFENAETKQWVVSYKGTDSLKSLLEDIIGVVEAGNSPQKAKAFEIVHQIIQGPAVLRLPAGYQLSFTGHSLGAFLALMSLYYAHTLKADWPSLHAVVFECPGMAESFKMIESHGRVINPLLLDIVNYVSYPNIINTFDSHIGETLYSAPLDLEAWGNWSRWYTKKAHSIDGFIDYLNPNHVEKHLLHCLSDWPINGASVVGGERGVYFQQARFDEENGRYIIDKKEGELIGSPPDKLYDKTRELLFDGHYHILAEDVFNPTRCLRLRHFAPGFQDFLGKFHGMRGLLLSSPELKEAFKKKAQSLAVPESIVELLLNYELKQDVDAQWFLTLTLAPEMGVTPYQFRKELSHWLADGGEAKISQLIISLAQGEEAIKDDRIKVVAEVIAKGAQVHGMVICNTVEGLAIYLPDTASEEEKCSAKDLLTHFKNVVKEVEVYVVAPGAIVSQSAIVASNYAAGVVISGQEQSQAPSQIDRNKILSDHMARHGAAGSSSNSSTTNILFPANLASDLPEITGLFSSVITLIPPGASVSGNIQDNIVIGTYADSVFPEPRKILSLSELKSWKLVNEIEHFVSRQDLMKEIQLRFNESAENTIVLSAMRGMGGVGKTTLANHIIHDTQSSFKAWFNVESISNLQSQYVDLGLACQLYTVKDKLSTDVMVNRVLRHLEDCPGWILVYDNVEKYEDIKALLPQSGGHIIITSRYRNWPEKAIIDIDVMDVEEAIALLRNIIGTKEDENIIKELVEKRLGLLPLAISQAGAYIKANENMSVMEYLDQYNENEKELLASEEMPPGDIHPAVSVTWKMNFEKIKEKASAAEGLLNVCTFLDAADIPEKLLINYLNKKNINKFQYNKAKMALLEYSLIKVNGKSLSIHRLVQAVLRHKIEQDIDTLNTVKKDMLDFFVNGGFKDYTEVMSSDKEAAEHKAYLKQLFIQAQSFLRYCDIHNSTFDKIKYANLLSYVAHCFSWHANYNEAKERHEQALNIYIAIYGEIHLDVAISLNNLANTLRTLGLYEEARIKFEQALKIIIAAYGEDHLETAAILNNLAGTLKELSLYEKARAKREQALKIIIAAYGENHPDVATSLNNLASVLYKLGRYEEARAKNEQALKINIAIYGEGHPLVAASLNNLATVLYELSLYEEARTKHEQALKINITIYGEDHPMVAASLNNLASVLHKLGRYEEARAKNERALKIRIVIYGENHPDVATSLNNLASILHKLGRYEEARAKNEQALKISIVIYGENHPDVATFLHNLAGTLEKLALYEEARTKYEQALKIRIATYGEDDPKVMQLLEDIENIKKIIKLEEVAISLNNLAGMLQALGLYREARTKYEQALEIGIAIYGENHPGIATFLNSLANVLYELGLYEETRTKSEQALKIIIAAYGKDHPTVSIFLHTLASVLKVLGLYEEARDRYEQVLKINIATYGEDHPKVASSLNNLANVLYELGLYEEARTKHEQALKIRIATYGKDHPKVASSLNNIAGILCELGLYEEARVRYEQALKINIATYGEEHPATLHNLANVLYKLGLYEEARARYEQILKIGVATYGEEYPSVALLRNSIKNIERIIREKKTEESNLGISYSSSSSSDAIPSVSVSQFAFQSLPPLFTQDKKHGDIGSGSENNPIEEKVLEKEIKLLCNSSSAARQIGFISNLNATQVLAFHEIKEFGNYLKITKEMRRQETVYEFNLTGLWQNSDEVQKLRLKEEIEKLHSKNRGMAISGENIIRISFLKDDAQILLDKLKEILFFDDNLLPGEASSVLRVGLHE